MRVKIITGFRKDQIYSIPAAEAHKAYFLFLNPEVRTVFSNGLAIKGSEIQRIEPDWQGTMGWNEAHVLDSDDWNEIHRSGKEKELLGALTAAQGVAKIGDPKDLNLPLAEAMKKYPALAAPERSGGMKQIGSIQKNG